MKQINLKTCTDLFQDCRRPRFRGANPKELHAVRPDDVRAFPGAQRQRIEPGGGRLGQSCHRPEAPEHRGPVRTLLTEQVRSI